MQNLKTQPLADLLIDHFGYTVDKAKDCRTWRALRSPSGAKIVVKASPSPNGHYLFKDDNGGGSVIELLQKYHGLSLEEIQNLPVFSPSKSNKTTIAETPPSQPRDKLTPQQVRFEVLRKLRTFEPRYGRNYFQKRGISQQVCELFKLQPTASLYSSILPLFSLSDGKYKYTTTIAYWMAYSARRKAFQTGLQRGGSYQIFQPFWHPFNPPKIQQGVSIYFFESPIDALSYATLKGWDEKYLRSNPVVFFSTCGTLTSAFRRSIAGDVLGWQPEEVFICFDNDQAGGEAATQLASILRPSLPKNTGLTFCASSAKDWNEELVGF